MELFIVEQNVRGGSKVLMVRHEKRPVLGFPLEMVDLANEMIAEAKLIDGSQLPALIEKYSLEKAKCEPPGLPHALPVALPHAGDTGAIHFSGEAISPPPDALAELLRCARLAEVNLATAREQFELASGCLRDAEIEADAAWLAFNRELRSALPPSSRIAGIGVNE